MPTTVEKDVQKSKKFLLFSESPTYQITLEDSGKKLVEVREKGAKYLEKILMGKTRFACFVKHVCEIDEADMERVRNADFYGYHFIEALPDEGIPDGSISLYEMRKQQPKRAEAWMKRMEQCGRNQITVMDCVDLMNKKMEERAQ